MTGSHLGLQGPLAGSQFGYRLIDVLLGGSLLFHLPHHLGLQRTFPLPDFYTHVIVDWMHMDYFNRLNYAI